MNDDQFFLANAYVDGELTADERALAEADLEVMTEVERLRALQAEVRDVAPPSAFTRDAAVAAAMREFGAARPGADTPTPPAAPVPYRPRPSYARYLAVAAAVVAVAGLGIVASQFGAGGDDDDSGAADAPAEETAEFTREGAPTAAVESNATDDGGDAAADADGDDGGGEEAVEEAGDMPEEAGEASVADTDSAESAADADVGADGGADPQSTTAAGADEATAPVATIVVPDDFDPDQPVGDELELATYATYLLDEQTAQRLPPTPNHSCADVGDVLARATYVPATDEPAEPIDVLVAVADEGALALAVESDSCDVLLVAALR